jgi:type IV pilus assembly protein PilC
MPVFAYTGRGAGKRVRGAIEAPDRTAALGELRRRAVLVTRIEEKAPGRRHRSASRGGVKARELAVFARQLSTMIDAGLPLVQGLAILAEQGESRILRRVTVEVARSVQTGSTLADAMKRHPRTFDDLFTNLVAAGEAGGILDVILRRLSSYIEKAAALQRKVKAALVYPATVIGVAAIVVTFMLTFVVPTFARMFATAGTELPAATRAVLWLSDCVRSWLLLIVAGMAGATLGLRRWRRTERGRAALDGLVLRLPGIGELARKAAVARFARTLGTLVASGVPIVEGLRITAGATGNAVVERAILHSRRAVIGGRTLAEPLRASAVFPIMAAQMIAVGEHTGALDSMLGKIADFYEDEVDTAVGALTALIEPLMIVILGLVIGGLVMAMYLPIFKMVTLVG